VFAVLIASGAIGTPLTEDVEDRVRLLELPVGVEAVQFTVIYADPDVWSSSWPGANEMRTRLVGTLTLPVSGKTVYVVTHAIEQLPSLEPKSRTGRLLPGFTRDDLLHSAEEGTLRGIAFGVDEDGMRWFMDARVVRGGA
jgi:hypothetical protein